LHKAFDNNYQLVYNAASGSEAKENQKTSFRDLTLASHMGGAF